MDLIRLLVNVYNWLLGMAALVAFLMLIYGGIRMLTYQFSESPDSDLENAKVTVRRAITGLVIILMAYVIVNTVLGLLGLDSQVLDTGQLQ